MATIRSQVTLKVGPRSDIQAELFSFNGLSDEKEHVALKFLGDGTADVALVRMHSECLTGDVFNSSRCDCGDQLEEAIDKVAVHGGVIIYLRQEGRGIGLYPKIDAYQLQDQGYDTYEANQKLGYAEDSRCFSVAGEMLEAMSINAVKLLTNNPQKEILLRESGIDIVETVRTGVFKKQDNLDYLQSKKDKKNHKMDL